MKLRAPVQVACVGVGYFSQYHYQSWARIDDVWLIAACDSEVDRAKATGLPAFADLSQMLARQKPDLLDVILPPASQADAIRIALEAGVKWIICQKPFCRSLAEAEALSAEADAKGATIVIHENFRFQPWYRAIKRVLDSGDCGEIHQARFHLRPGDGQGEAAYLDRQPYFRQMPRFLVHETAIHWVDTFRYLFGTPVSVYADLRQINPAISGEDAGFILFDHANGVRSLFDGNRHLDHVSDDLRRTIGTAVIEGSEGTLELRGDGSVSLRRFGDTAERIILAPDEGSGFGGDCVHALQSHVISALLNGTVLENTAPDYLEVIRIEEAIYLSAALGCKQGLNGR
ncbi:MAG: Gfo/Idh/MocA family oxidoreductase [Pseudomonadota bacterium]